MAGWELSIAGAVLGLWALVWRLHDEACPSMQLCSVVAHLAVCWQHSVRGLPGMQVQALYPPRAEEGVHDLAGSLPGAHDSAGFINSMTL